LGDEVDPAAVGGRELQGGLEGGRRDVDGVLVEVDEDVAVAVLLLQEQRVGAADDVRLGAEVGEDVELLEGGVGAEEAALGCVSTRLDSGGSNIRGRTLPNICSGNPMYESSEFLSLVLKLVGVVRLFS
jgi:hypothetical protein